jgi:NAD(P)H-dependent flavin oxidoreductase YrpB (nitropropane dioxygenase family)
MLHTLVCELLGIEFPVIQAGMGLLTSAELVAAVSNAGGLGSLGAGLRSPEDLKQQFAQTRELTQRPFAVNHLLSMLNEEALALTLDAKPSCISFALADPGNFVQRAAARRRDTGCRGLAGRGEGGRRREADRTDAPCGTDRRHDLRHLTGSRDCPQDSR